MSEKSHYLLPLKQVVKKKFKKKGKKEEEDEHMNATSFIPLHTTSLELK